MQTVSLPLPPLNLDLGAESAANSRLARALDLGQRVEQTLNRALAEGRSSSFRRLASQDFGSYAPSSLWRALNVFRLAARYPELESYRHIGVGHVSVVLGLPEPETMELLRHAEQQKWSRRHLEQEVRARKLPIGGSLAAAPVAPAPVAVAPH